MAPELLSGLAFLRPAWLIALLPCLACVLLLQRQVRARSGWDGLLPPRWLGWLLRGSTTPEPAPYLLLAAGWTLAVLALAGPAIRAPVHLAEHNQASVVVVLDLSRNMLSADLPPSRLDQARRKIQDLLLQPEGYQVGLIAYAGSAHRVTPISNDNATLANLLGTLEPGLMPSQGNALGAALNMAREMIEDLPRNTTAVLLVTSGAEGSGLEELDEQASALGSQLAILGVGTPAGSPVALPEGGFMRDAAGRILLPRLDAQALAELARRHGAGYHNLTRDDADLEHLLSGLGTRVRSSAEEQMVVQDVGHWLLLPLVFLAALGLRRGWLGVLLCCSLLPAPAEASWADLWQRPDQQAADLLEAQRPAEAAARFQDPAWRSWAQFQAEQFEASVAGYAHIVEQNPNSADNHYNHGTALAAAGRYDEALEAFEQALTRQPDHHGARHNRAQVEALLERLAEEARQAELAAEQDQAGEPADGDSARTEPEGSAESPASQPSGEAAGDAVEARAQPGSDEPGAPLPESVTPGQTGDALASGDSAAISSPADGARASEPGATPTQPQEREQRQALQQWLEDIPDNPGELLRRKFLHQHMQQREGQ